MGVPLYNIHGTIICCEGIAIGLDVFKELLNSNPDSRSWVSTPCALEKRECIFNLHSITVLIQVPARFLPTIV